MELSSECDVVDVGLADKRLPARGIFRIRILVFTELAWLKDETP